MGWPVVGVLVALGAAACGRFGFEASADAGRPLDAAEPCADRLFCDTFDDGFAQWDGVSATGAMVNHDPTFGRSGGSVHAVAPVDTATATLYEDLFTTLPPDFYIRLFLYAPSGGLLDLEPLELTDLTSSHQIVFSIYDTNIDIHAHSMAADFVQRIDQPMPRDRWVCMELHVQIGPSGLVELAVDGQPLLVQTAVDTRPPNGDLRRMRVGIPSKPLTVPGDVHVDDVIVDTAPIGCN